MPKARVGESTRGGLTPFFKGGLGDLPRENFQIQDVCRSDSEAIFACETRLIVQTLPRKSIDGIETSQKKRI